MRSSSLLNYYRFFSGQVGRVVNNHIQVPTSLNPLIRYELTWPVAFLSFSRRMSLLACSSSISSSSSCIFCSRRRFSSTMAWDLLEPLLSSSCSSSLSDSAWRRSLSDAEWSYRGWRRRTCKGMLLSVHFYLIWPPPTTPGTFKFEMVCKK